MKKSMIFAAAAAALLAVSACSTSTQSKESEPKDETYTGILPAADAAGVRYTLKLKYDDKADTAGSYELTQTYLEADSVTPGVMNDKSKFETKGTFAVKDDAKKYIELTPEAGSEDSKTLYFLIPTDSTVELVNSALEPSVNPELNYTLKLQK